MHDKGKVIAGIVIFLIIVLFPIWFSVIGGGVGEKPVLAKAKGDECVEPAEWMRARHMQLLDTWRADVVRRSDRTHVSPSGVKYEKSLTRTCLSCHESKAAFCDRCHEYTGVVPACWNCHIVPGGRK